MELDSLKARAVAEAPNDFARGKYAKADPRKDRALRTAMVRLLKDDAGRRENPTKNGPDGKE
ncbi:MAG: hypothetical protein BIFFINMI_02154 [Phycisphaerae bacterium]|nr:hypothetical protein [Phycisphaerae bacterium]